MELYNGLPVLKISVDEIHQGVNKISLVDFPAIEENYYAFSKIEDEVLRFEEIEQQKLAGPLLIPDKYILREHPKTKQRFYVVFTREVIAEIVERFNENLNGRNFNQDHSEDVDGLFMLENWIIEDPDHDKAKYKFNHVLPAGTWYGIVKVKNTDLWLNRVKTGELRGFSVEMLAGLKLAIDNAVIEQTALDNLDGLGEEIPGNWTLIDSQDIAEDEATLTADEILGAYNFRISAKPDQDSTLDRDKADGTGRWRVRYKYVGPSDSKNRNFCAKLLRYQRRTGKVFRKEDIDQMSFRGENKDFGIYSIFTYKGSYGCRHRWQRLIFFEDYEDQEVRKVGRVPAVTRNVDDTQAIKVNPKPSSTQFSKIDNMNEANLKLATVEELAVEERVVGATVDNEDGTYEVEGVTYTVVEGAITEVAEAEAPAEAPAEEPAEEPAEAPAEDWQGMVMEKLAELEAKVEQLSAMVMGSDQSNAEQFSKADLEGLFSKFAEELKPAKEEPVKVDTEKVELSQLASAISTINKLKDRNN
ncbi:MAG: XkdF-like putative serine protease domain-containing protein [Planctomycetota bacterium]|jgi:hypothetical protein